MSKKEKNKDDIEELRRQEEKETAKEKFNKVMNVILWIVLIIWMGICLVDFFNTQFEKKPIFCINKTTTEYKDGNVDICTGVGYKVINYKRKSYRGNQYGPFWIKDKSESAVKNSK